MSCLYSCTGGKDKKVTVESDKESSSFIQGMKDLAGKFVYPVAFTQKQKNTKELTRGTYEIEGVMENLSGVSGTFRNKEIEIPWNGDSKLVNVRKLVINEPKKMEGGSGSHYKAVIDVIENPLPMVPIIWGLSAIGSLTAGWFFVDKVEKYTTTGIGGIVTVVVAIIALWQFAFKGS